MELERRNAEAPPRAPKRRGKAVGWAGMAALTGGALFALIGVRRARRAARRGGVVREAITINRPPDEVYRFWRDLENLPLFMQHLQSVQVFGDGRSHWTTRGPAGRTAEWDAEIVEDRPGELIAWRSLPGASVQNGGSVRFVPAPGRQGTEVHVEMCFQVPAGALGAAVAKAFRESPEQQTRDDLRALKQVMETGAVVRSDATRRRGRHPARPAVHARAMQTAT